MKRPLSKVVYLLLATILLIAQFPLSASAAATSTDTVQVSKTVEPSKILSGEEADIKLNVQGSGDVSFVKPNDIILIIDRSGSMAPTYAPNNGEDKMKNAKEAAKGFIDLVDFSKHRVGVVDFASNTSYKDLSTDPAALKQYIDGIKANGGTGTRDAIKLAQQLLANHRADAQPVIILMTDGQATEPSPDSYARQVALEQASSAKSEGIVFYTIALLLKSENPDTSAPNLLMKDMATTAHHHHFVLGSVGLAEIYRAIVDEIGVASAYDVTITDTVAPEFEIVPDSYKDNIPQPIVTGNTLVWKFNELKKETLTLSYKIRHKTGAKVGKLSVGAQDINVKYKDYSGNPHEYNTANPIITVSYPAPTITSVVKDNGNIKGGETVEINGQYFRDNAKVFFGGTPATSVQFVDSTKLLVTTPAGAQGQVEVKVTNDDGQFATATYRYLADPIITSIDPNYGPLAGGNEVKISGNYFLTGVQVKFGDQPATVVSVAPKLIVVKAPASAVAESVDVKVINPDATEVTVEKGYTYVLGPELLSLTPDHGFTLGGESVTLNGTRFIDGAKVYFNSVQVPATFVSDKELAITTPPWAANESVKVKVLNPDGQYYVLDKGYTYVYPQPIITGIEPKEGLVAGGTVVKISGSHFLNGAKVYLDNTLVSAVSFISDKEIQFRTPAWAQADTVDLKVVNPDAQEAVLENAFTYLLPAAPTLSGVTPAEGPTAGGTSVTLKGTNFLTGSKLYFDTKEVAISSLTATQIVANTPAWSTAEKVDIKLVDPYGRESVLADAFLYIAPPPPPGPSILSVTPDSGPQAGGNIVSIKGTEFANGLKLYFNDTPITTFSYMGKELISVKMPAWSTAGIISIKVVNPDGQESVLADAYTYIAPPPPEVISLSPNKGLISGGTTVTLTGANFVNGAKVKLGDKEMVTTFNSSSQLTFKTAAWTNPETVDVTVINPDGQLGTLQQGFTFETPPPPPAPVVHSVSPDSGPQAGGTIVTIKGENFVNGAKVLLGQKEFAATFMSGTELMIRTPSWTSGETVDVGVVNPDGQKGVLQQAFKYIAPPPKPAPSISAVTPNSGETTGGVIVSIKGANFESGSKVYFNDTLIASTYYSSSELQLRSPKWSTSGAVNVKVENPDGQVSVLENGFTYILPPPPPAPVVESASPNSVVTTTPTNVTITGKNFVNGAKVRLGTVELTATFYSATQLAVRTPVWNQPGAVDITVINPDGQTGVLSGGLNVVLPPPPTITSISPNSGLNTGGTVITIIGTSFTSTSKVLINGVQAPATFYSSTDLRAKVPASTAVGPVDVTVLNSDGQSVVQTGGFTYTAPAPKPAPTITSVTPNNGSKSGGNIISVVGTNFESGSKVYINGVLAGSSYFSSTNLQVRVPASSVTGPVEVKVVNVDGQVGVLANAYTYN